MIYPAARARPAAVNVPSEVQYGLKVPLRRGHAGYQKESLYFRPPLYIVSTDIEHYSYTRVYTLQLYSSNFRSDPLGRGAGGGAGGGGTLNLSHDKNQCAVRFQSRVRSHDHEMETVSWILHSLISESIYAVVLLEKWLWQPNLSAYTW